VRSPRVAIAVEGVQVWRSALAASRVALILVGATKLRWRRAGGLLALAAALAMTLGAIASSSPANQLPPRAQSAGALRNCGLLHLSASVPQDGRSTHRERVLARRSVRCARAKHVGRHYLYRGHGPDHGTGPGGACAGSGCFGTIGPWFCGNGKRRHELVECSLKSGGDRAPLQILVLAVY
jgi:hypothetical protein